MTAPKRPRPMGIAWGLTFLALVAAIGSYYRPGPLQLASFVFVALAIVCLIIARRDELRDHNDQLVALRLEADLAMNAATQAMLTAHAWQGIALMEADVIRAQGDAIHERDESAQEIIERWAETVR